ncbi:retrovirus-related pol polyprotein from transposon TNT 1-94 [Tanacetum coccineum]
MVRFSGIYTIRERNIDLCLFILERASFVWVLRINKKELNNHTPKEDQTDQEDGDDEDAWDQEIDQPPDLTDYQLARDRERRKRTKPLRRDEFSEEEQDLGVSRSSSWAKAYYELEQLDVKTAFLHENLKEVIYMRQPPGYEQATSKAKIGSTKSLLKTEFDMKELGEAKKILGMEIVRDQSRKILRVSQSGYVSKILNNFRIYNGKSVQMPLGRHFKLSLKDCPVRDCDVKRVSKVPYANAVGSLMYLMVCTRPYIAYAASVVSRYMANPGKNHWEAVKWIFKYLRGTANVGLVYGIDRGNHVNVTGFVDSDYAKDPDKEAKYMALTEVVKEAIWLRGLLEELGVELNTVTVNCDNQGAIHLSRNHVFHERTKRINVRYHFIREVLEAKTVKVLKVGTKHNVADALTNVVPGRKLQHCLELLNVGIG